MYFLSSCAVSGFGNEPLPLFSRNNKNGLMNRSANVADSINTPPNRYDQYIVFRHYSSLYDEMHEKNRDEIPSSLSAYR
jgi:hypothetical protein